MANIFTKGIKSILKKYAGNNIIVNKTTVKPVRRGSLDIAKWRQAIQQAEGHSQQRKQLYDLYTDILLDGYLSSVIERRVENITNTDLAFIAKDGTVIEEISDLVDTSYFETILTEIMNATFWGHSLIELMLPRYMSSKKGEVVLVPRKHVKPRWGIVTEEEYGMSGHEYREKPFGHKIIEVGNPEDLGLFVKVAQYVIYKRGNFGDWAEFANVFGIPFRHATYNNETQRAVIEEGLEKAGSAGYMVSPDGTNLEFLSGNSSGNGSDVFRFLRDACNEEIAFAILGNTMTTKDSKSGGYAQSKTHSDKEDLKHKADRKTVLRVLNEQLIPYLALQGYPVADGKFQWQDEQHIDLIDKIEIDLKVAEKVAIPDDYWYKTYGLPKPEASAAKTDPEPDPTDDDDGDDDDSKPKPPKKKVSPEIKLNAMYGIHASSCDCGNCINLAAAQDVKFSAISRKLEQAIIKAVKGGDYKLNEALHRAYYQRLRDFARAGFSSSLSNPSDWINFELKEGIKRNISDFAAAKQESLIAELRQALTADPSNFDRKGKEIMRRYNKMYLKAELRTFEAAANTASQWRGFEDNVDLYPNLQFSTVGDDRVRPSHAALDGAIYPVMHPFWNTHTPPLDWQCRCIVLQSDDAVNELAVQTAARGLGGNPFRDKALVTKAHPYFQRSNNLADLFTTSDEFRATIERAGILKRARKQMDSLPLIEGKQATLSNTDLLEIVNGKSDNEAVRNALLSAINLVLAQMSKSTSIAAGSAEAYQIEILGLSFLLEFENAETLALKSIRAI